MKSVGLLVVWTFGLTSTMMETQTAQVSPRFDFKGKLLVIACDTDMLPSAYIDGKLGPEVGPDVLSVIRLDRRAMSPNRYAQRRLK